jgi:hypothetical protein
MIWFYRFSMIVLMIALNMVMFVPLFASDGGEKIMETKTLRIIKSESGANELDVEVIIYQKPPFYRGSMPLKFISRKQFVGPNSTITLEHRHAEWTNTYRYEDPVLFYSGIATESRTTDKEDKVLATARLSRLIKGQGIEIEEIHYNTDGQVVFKCTSTIDFGIGFKKTEDVTFGKKQNDYYFVWPVSTLGGT